MRIFWKFRIEFHNNKRSSLKALQHREMSSPPSSEVWTAPSLRYGKIQFASYGAKSTVFRQQKCLIWQLYSLQTTDHIYKLVSGAKIIKDDMYSFRACSRKYPAPIGTSVRWLKYTMTNLCIASGLVEKFLVDKQNSSEELISVG